MSCLISSLLSQVCTKLQKGGPNNATYVAGYTLLDREHVINIGIVPTNDQLTGTRLFVLLLTVIFDGWILKALVSNCSGSRRAEAVHGSDRSDHEPGADVEVSLKRWECTHCGMAEI